MAFENITKGEWRIDEQKVKINKWGTTVFPLRIDTEPMCFTNVVRVYEPEGNKQNAEFIAYCFNLQQRFDISKLEELVESTEVLLGRIKENDFDNWFSYKTTKQLLTQIKK